jgi:signal transduction histidine kinase
MQQSAVQTYPTHPRPSAIQRETIHDLRNLFGIVSSAKHLLEGQPAKVRRLALLQAIETAAIRGGELTSSLLAAPKAAGLTKRIDLNSQIMTLEPMLHTLVRGIQFDLGDEDLTLRVDPDALDAVIFELVANAKAAGAETVTIRTRRLGARAILKVVDDGCGMDRATLARVRRCEDRRAEHGAGLSRVQAFARAVHAQLRIHSRAGRGTVVTVTLPTVLRMAACEPGAVRTPFPPMMKEKTREKNRRASAA